MHFIITDVSYSVGKCCLGNVLDEDWEWEKDDEQMAEALRSRISMETPLQPSLDCYDNDEELDLDEVSAFLSMI